MTITAKYAARCATCSGPVTPGQRIEWAKGSPVRHTACQSATVVATSSMLAPSPVRTVAPARTSRRPGKWTGCSCGSREDSYGDLIPARNNCASCEFDA